MKPLEMPYKLVLASTALCLLAGCGEHKAAGGAAPAAAVSVAKVLSRPIQQWDEFNGRISAVDAVEIRPRVSGYVERIAFDEGGEVRKGDLLFVIDPRPYRAALDIAAARLERAQAGAVLAEKQAQRSNALFKKNATSQEEAERTTAEYEQGRADVIAAKAAVEAAKLDLQFSEVRAPVTGRVSHAMLTVGNLAMANQTVLTTVVSQDPVYVDFYPDEENYLRYQAKARRGAKDALSVRVGLVNEQGFPHEGRLKFLDNRVDPSTGTNHMRAVLQNPDHQLTPGLYAHVQFAGLAPSEAALIDDKAVMTDQDRKYVYVLGAGDKAERREVTLGAVNHGLRVVESGLSAKDYVIVDGLQRVFYPGAPVKPTVVAMGAPAAQLADAQ
ncbi:efflux RND transporter periplasmic adaptor subunit [Massilia luteola]|uniref:efflux RND transporter periplasmic adaptor subunit n=1 Tax=Massilia luteola TaxID=3081751 RepID=UPI002ACBE396|nr:efflux RND transporter periplasmic adaptor subunit [Massilia sp. Gc5]